MKTTQASGKTLDGAVEKALAELGLTREQVDVKVLQEGGFLKNFKVEVTEILTPAQKIQAFLSLLNDAQNFLDLFFFEFLFLCECRNECGKRTFKPFFHEFLHVCRLYFLFGNK